MKYINQSTIYTVVVILIVCSISCQIMIGVFYQNMMRATDSMTTTENKLLKQCKQKFIQCYRTNGGVANISVFVDRFLNKIKIMKLTVRSLWHLSGQLILLSVIVAGFGVFRGIVSGIAFQKLMPYYILSFVGLYLFFGMATMIDIQGSRKIVKTNLIDFLENHVAVRLQTGMEESNKLVKEAQIEAEEEKKQAQSYEKGTFTEEDAKELEELLKAFL